MKEKFIHGIFVVDCALLTRASYNEHTSSFDNHREWAQWGILPPACTINISTLLIVFIDKRYFIVMRVSVFTLFTYHDILQLTFLAITRGREFSLFSFSAKKGGNCFMNTIEWFGMHIWLYNCYCYFEVVIILQLFMLLYHILGMISWCKITLFKKYLN